MLTVALAVISFLGIVVMGRILLGPTVWDRLLGLNMIASKILIAIVILARLMDLSYLLDIALVYAVLGFLGTILMARFIEKRGDI
ncbi:MAG: pH regulation protein F [Clostridiaceae bacterium]|jgi:multisubunit Na+/H+ antiporter MnhF subunit|nr:pH regulation protein F [Clostridiaceae bacterium]